MVSNFEQHSFSSTHYSTRTGVDVEKASAPPVPGQNAPPPGITFDRFVRACVVIRTLTEAFQKLDSDRDGWIQISYDQFMQTVLSAP